jgi:hypothetical protein
LRTICAAGADRYRVEPVGIGRGPRRRSRHGDFGGGLIPLARIRDLGRRSTAGLLRCRDRDQLQRLLTRLGLRHPAGAGRIAGGMRRGPATTDQTRDAAGASLFPRARYGHRRLSDRRSSTPRIGPSLEMGAFVLVTSPGSICQADLD